MPYFVYLMECTDGTLYTGITTNVERRFKEHSETKKGARYTRAHPPLRIRYTEAAASRSTALQREAAIKRLPRAAKLALRKQPKTGKQ